MAHKITVVLFPPSQARKMKAEAVVSPFAKATLYTLDNESVHDRIGRLQAETENMMFQIVDITEVGAPILDGTGVDPSYHAPFSVLSVSEAA